MMFLSTTDILTYIIIFSMTKSSEISSALGWLLSEVAYYTIVEIVFEHLEHKIKTQHWYMKSINVQ